MEHENVDENARYLVACENVKKIVNAIKLIKMKYYTNFARISDEDKKVYEQLEANLEKISQENGLDRLKVALMEEVSAKYDQKGITNEPGNPNSIDKKLLACYGAVDVQQRALSYGKIQQALRCQKILKQRLEEIGSPIYGTLVTEYKRKKLEELINSKSNVQKRNETWMKNMKACCKPEDVIARSVVTDQIEKARNNLVTLFNKTKDQSEQGASPMFGKTKDEDTEGLQIG